jgi:hypothetical protein
MYHKILLLFSFLVLAFVDPALAGDNAVPCASPPGVLIFQDGTQMHVECYSIKGQLIVLKTTDGNLHSVPLSLVDLESTEHVNGAVGSSDDDTAPQSSSSATNVRSSTSDPNEGASRPEPAVSFVSGSGDEKEPDTTTASARAPSTIDGPAPPVAPEVMARDDAGRVTVRAVRLSEPLQIDGKLEESVYRTVPAISGFTQQEPHAGEPATEETAVWVFFDEGNVYVSARCWDSHPERMVANEMRRDNFNLAMNENFAVIFDTFHDRRNGFLFYTNPLGGLYDAQVTDEANTNSDWNTVWEVKTGRFPQGWTVEMEFPFKSLRYKPGASQVWGINFRRLVRWKNEKSHLAPIPVAYRRSGIIKLSFAATIVGIEPPARSLNLEVKPYATAGLRTDLTADEPYTGDFDGDIGFDAKYGVTRSMTFDFTYNTDFAQVEIDEQQVNLTRFSLFFPEKREFFLEGQGIFNFGGREARDVWEQQSDMPIMFYSRRIGLQDGNSVPINAGGRLTGRAGSYTVGALAMQTNQLIDEEIPTTNFGVARVKRDLFRRSSVGFIGTYRSEGLDTVGSSSTFGVDGNFSFFENLHINTHWAKTWTPDLVNEDESYRGAFRWGNDLLGVDLEHMVVGENFNPEVGYLRRDDMRKNFGKFRFSPRPRSIRAIRQFYFEGSLDHITNLAGQLETRVGLFMFQTQFDSGDRLYIGYVDSYEFLDEEFEISDDVIIPIGGYRFSDWFYSYWIGPQRRVQGLLNFEHGDFYSGKYKATSYWGRVELTKQFSLEPFFSFNWVDLPEGKFTTSLILLRANISLTPRAFIGALVQYNSSNDSLTSNVRFRWEYRPGSDIFVVYSDGRDTTLGGFPHLENRSLVFKITRLFRF